MVIPTKKNLIYPYGVMETRVTLTHKLLVQVQLRVPFDDVV